MDQRIRKLMTMYKALHPRDDIDGLYVSRKEGGRSLVNIEDCVDATIQALEEYTQKTKERLIATEARNSNCKIWTNRGTTKTRKQKWEEKQLYGYFKRQTAGIAQVKSWSWLRMVNLQRKMGSLITAAQDNAIRTNYIKAKIDRAQQNSKCRMCGDKDKTVNHIVSECSKLAQRDIQTRHDWVGKVIHWELCKELNFHHATKWYTHKPESVLENETIRFSGL